eukprot:TRINITY_DN5429_c0_g1_i3.p1 TRINITY_DN5429_c0_g1~~TRINITY_DN5429_c0_g1_i3.p1  ORF type:complete len:183 (-),score=49.76 TRINITY_DN5429_c0_g1_i3:38-586(-)
MTNTIKQNYEMKKQRDMTSLKELSQEVREMEESNSNRGFNEKRKKLLQEQRQEILTNIEKLEKEEKETELAVEEFKRKLEELNNKLVVLENESKDTIFPLRQALNIYLAISSIKWNYESPNVSGTIFFPHSVKPFQFSGSMSPYDRTNTSQKELWNVRRENEIFHFSRKFGLSSSEKEKVCK